MSSGITAKVIRIHPTVPINSTTYMKGAKPAKANSSNRYLSGSPSIKAPNLLKTFPQRDSQSWMSSLGIPHQKVKKENQF